MIRAERAAQEGSNAANRMHEDRPTLTGSLRASSHEHGSRERARSAHCLKC
jgi:hypothetical protein